MILVVRRLIVVPLSLTFLSLLFLSACQKDRQQVIHGETMGTTYTLRYVVLPEFPLNKQEIYQRVESYLVEFNQVFSTYDSQSEISLVNAAGNGNKEKNFEVSDLFRDQLLHALEFYSHTDYTFDPTISPLVNLWGFGWKKNYQEDNFNFPDDNQVALELEKVGMSKIKLTGNLLKMPAEMELDFSAISKGRAVDGVSRLLEDMGINHYLVEIGGEIRVKGSKRGDDFRKNLEKKSDIWKVLISAPESSDSKNQVFKLINLKGMSIATSGDYQNFYKKNGKKYSHIIDPRNGYPVRHRLASVSVITPTCEEADALATAIMVMGEVEGKKYIRDKNIAAFLIYQNGDFFETFTSPEFLKYIFPQ